MGVIIFVDNSNIFIGGKNKYGKEARFDYEKFVKTVRRGDTLTKKWIFGSTPPSGDSLWNYMKCHGWEVTAFDRPFGRGEKQVDTSIVAEGVDLIARSITSGRLVFLSGDKDFLPLINKAKQYKWSVELWAYEQDMSQELAVACDSVNYLDEHTEFLFFSKEDGSTETYDERQNRIAVECEEREKLLAEQRKRSEQASRERLQQESINNSDETPWWKLALGVIGGVGALGISAWVIIRRIPK
jgi:hypothetical protein